MNTVLFSLAPAVGGVGTLLLALSARNRDSRRLQKMNEIDRRRQFWSDWINQLGKEQEPLAADKARATHELYRCAQLIEELYLHWPAPKVWTRKAYKAQLNDTSLFQRLTLNYRLWSGLAQLYKILVAGAAAFSVTKGLEWLLQRTVNPSESRDAAIVAIVCVLAAGVGRILIYFSEDSWLTGA